LVFGILSTLVVGGSFVILTPMPTSAGILLYRLRGRDRVPEVLLVHPGGPFFAKKDPGVWTIPKGIPEAGEDLLDCAKREFREETGFDLPAGPFLPLGSVKQKGGKTVHVWAVQGDCDPALLRSNTFTLQWPPKSGKWIDAPEIDRAAWFDLEQARAKINPAQAELLKRLCDQVQDADRNGS
jgi:predicted NUDIX family NTP pyrophosphohydrolase